ncbi:DNA-binding transcriptional LysR family regulator [Aminobacter lissarensis]|uniref:DNA-binding transcriptional LysR family regulator n=1 Tax=Aminobacter carboxidus TaxID=376165 RepID=A0A8E2BFU1_9HYPH|nr:LysR family transcriptional regulator [Aminobacter lissarensis]MBB6469147.1 DNA-binding transcriptional LysR family regulator [Aminobacter lissarensis]
MDKWTELEVFVRIAEEASLTRAGDSLSMSVSGVSRYLMHLETRLGVRLVQRSTRQLSLTSEGEKFYTQAREIISHMLDAEASVAAGASNPTGRLRVGASLSFSLLHLMPVVEQFRQSYPNVTIEIVSSNRYYDIVENGLDLAVRTRRVEADSSITIRRLAETRRLLAASPAYLERRGMPQHPQDLADHDLILYTLADSWNQFSFRKGSEQVKVEVDGIINANDGQLICVAARDGLGILAQPAYIIQKDLEAGRLVRVLDDWDLPRLTMNIAFPTKVLLPARTRLFIDFLIERFRVGEYERIWTQ